MCGYFCTEIIDYCLQETLEFTTLFSPNNFKRNDDIILKQF